MGSGSWLADSFGRVSTLFRDSERFHSFFILICRFYVRLYWIGCFALFFGSKSVNLAFLMFIKFDKKMNIAAH